jgi:hypothetical protein
MREAVFSGDSLTVEIRQTFALGQASVVEGSVFRDRALIASGILKLWEEHPSAGTPADVSTHPASTPNTSRCSEESPVFLSDCLTDVSLADAAEYSVQGTFLFPGNFIGFQGHFPGFPVLPGVFMIQMASLVAEKTLGFPVVVVSVDLAKFRHLVHRAGCGHIHTDLYLHVQDRQR